MHTFSPQKLGKLHITLPLLLFFLSFASVVAAAMSDAIPDFIMQLTAVISIVLAVQIITRYSLTNFVYEIDQENKKLNITKITGKKSTLAGAIEFADIISIDKKEEGYSAKEKYKKSFRSFNFCNNIFPPCAYYLILNVAGEDITVLVELNDAFLNMIEEQRNIQSEGENI